MKKKILLTTGVLAVVSALGFAGAASVGGVHAEDKPIKYETIEEWDLTCQGANTAITPVTNGYEIAGLDAYGTRIASKTKVQLDGLEFKLKVHDLADSVGDCLGVIIQGTENPHAYFSESTAMVYSFWSLYGQFRNVFGSNHDYNYTNCYSDTSKSTADGMSSAGGNLVSNYVEDYEQTLKFEKVDDTWYKLTIYGSQIWGSPNYNATSGKSAYTYFKAADASIDEDGLVYLGFYGLNPTAPHKPVLTISNIRNAKVEAVAAPVDTQLAALDATAAIDDAYIENVEAANEAYEGLTAEAKLYVSNGSVANLTLCKVHIESEAFKAAVNLIPTDVTLTAENKALIDNAREIYDDMMPESKLVVATEYAKLVAAEGTYNALKEALDNAVAAANKKIDDRFAEINLPASSYSDEVKIAVTNAYDKGVNEIKAAKTPEEAAKAAEDCVKAMNEALPKKGCGGAVVSSIIGVSAVITALGCVLLAKKRKED